MVTSSTDDLREKVPVKIVKGAGLEKTMNELFNNFEAGEQRNAELVNRFFDQPYFRGEESLINKLIEVKDNIKFGDIKDEGINLAVLFYDKWAWKLKETLDSFDNDALKELFIIKIHDKLNAIIGALPTYAPDFGARCGTVIGDTNVLGYFQKIVNYLEEKERAGGGAKKVFEILEQITITNEDLNGGVIPLATELKDASIPSDAKEAFDKLLSFEIGKEADRTISISNDFLKSFQKLLTNSLPAINTVVGESDEYKYDERKLGTEYQGRAQSIRENTSLSEEEKNKQINDLRREYYIKYLKTKNSKIGNALEQLYNNDFDYSKIERNVLKDYFDKVADIRLQMLFDKGINEYLKLNWGNVNEFKAFYKDLTDVDPSSPTLNITLSDVNLPGSSPRITTPINIPVQRKLVEGPNERLKDINQFGKDADKSFDAFPMEFTINKADINALDINIEDRTKLLNLLSKYDKGDKYEIKGEDIGTLIYLFFIINNRLPITELAHQKQKEVESLFGKAKNHKNGSEGENTGENNEGDEEYTSEKFKEEMEKLGPGKFENGSEIWIPASESELPGGGYQRMKIKISNLNMTEGTFTGTVFGGELKFSNYEGKSRKFKMDKKTLEKFKETSKKISNTKDNVWLQPDPNKSDFNSFRESLNGKLGTSNLTFPTEGVTWNGNKFMQKIVDNNGKEEEVEVKYFGASADDKSTYKIEYNPVRRSFTVSSTFNWDEKGKNGKSEKKRFSYKRDMDWNNFLIFFNQKGLYPQTEEESNDAIQRQDNEFKVVNGGHRKLNWFTINNIRHGLKDIFGALKKKIDDYNKAQDEKFRKSVEGPILNALGKLTFLSPSLKSAIGERQQEIYNEELNGAWTEIEKYLKALQSDGQFADTFDQVPPHVQTIYGKSYKQFIIDLFGKKSESSTEEKRKAAALLLANIQKGSSPYRGLSGLENKGLWIKVILGNAHYEQFLRDKQKCINKLRNAGKEKDQIQDVLATCEMDYIINNVTGANGKLEFFGSHEGRGIPGKDGTNYVPNPSKRLLSEKFANELKNSYQGWFNKSSVEEAFGKISHNDFNLAKEDFKRLIKTSRFPGAIANLKKMFMLAKNSGQKSEYQKCFLMYMLSGVLDVNGKKDLRKQTYQWAKTMGFLPGMLAKETNHSQKVVTLLDDFCQEEGYEKFSKSVKSYFREGDLKNGELNIDNLIKELDSRWTVDKMEAFEKYSKSDFPSKKFSENPVLDKLQKDALNTGMENIDNSLLDNPVVANSGGLLSNANVVRDRMAIKDGVFDGKDPDERNNRAEFWTQIAKDVDNMSPDSSESVNLVLNQYFSRFGLNSEYDRQESYEWITTAYYWKDRIGREVRYKYNGREDKQLTMGRISPEDIKDILRYTFKGKVMSSCFSSRRIPSELNGALDSFQIFFEKAFDNNLLQDSLVVSDAFKSGGTNITPMLLGSRETYKDVLSGGDNDFADDIGVGDDDFTNDKQRRKAQKKVFQTGGFINHKIAQIEKSLKRLPSGMYRPITQDVNHSIEGLVELL